MRSPRFLGRWALVVVLLVVAGGCDWSQFMGGPDHSGFNAGETTLSVTNVAHLRRAWSVTLPSAMQASPVVANGRLYIGTLDADHRLYALDAQSGHPLWKASSGAVSNAAGVADGIVYAFGSDNQLHAFDAATGATRWSVPFPWESVNPTVASGKIFAAGQNTIVALDARTGTTIWTYGLAVADRDAYGHDSPAYANGVVYAAGGKLHAIDATTGTTIWTATPGARLNGPTVVGSTVYLGTSDANPSIYAFDTATGVQRWAHPVNNPVYSTPAVAHGLVYAGTEDVSGLTGMLYALDATTGNEVWHFAPAQGTWLGSVAVANGVAYDAGPNGLEARNATTGSLLKNISLGCGNNPSSPAVANGYVYIACASTIYAYTVS